MSNDAPRWPTIRWDVPMKHLHPVGLSTSHWKFTFYGTCFKIRVTFSVCGQLIRALLRHTWLELWGTALDTGQLCMQAPSARPTLRMMNVLHDRYSGNCLHSWFTARISMESIKIDGWANEEPNFGQLIWPRSTERRQVCKINFHFRT